MAYVRSDMTMDVEETLIFTFKCLFLNNILFIIHLYISHFFRSHFNHSYNCIHIVNPDIVKWLCTSPGKEKTTINMWNMYVCIHII